MDKPMSFTVLRRNYGHWDICTIDGRAFAIRGGPGNYFCRDERRDRDINNKTFNTLAACMAYVCDIFMHELIVAEGQKPHVIESWNVPNQEVKNG